MAPWLLWLPAATADKKRVPSIWSDPERRKPMDMRIPMGRWGTPTDFEGVAVFLSSAASDYITGVLIPVDGGYTNR